MLQLLQQCYAHQREQRFEELKAAELRRDEEQKLKQKARNAKKDNMVKNMGKPANYRSEREAIKRLNTKVETKNEEEIDYIKYIQAPYPQAMKDKYNEIRELEAYNEANKEAAA